MAHVPFLLYADDSSNKSANLHHCQRHPEWTREIIQILVIVYFRFGSSQAPRVHLDRSRAIR